VEGPTGHPGRFLAGWRKTLPESGGTRRTRRGKRHGGRPPTLSFADRRISRQPANATPTPGFGVQRMKQAAKATLKVQGATITVVPHDGQDFISLTDIAKHKNPEHPDDVVRNWLRNRGTVEFLGI